MFQEGAITGPPKCEGKPLGLSKPIIAGGCYEKGSEGTDFFNNDERICKCKEGYFGSDCGQCWLIGGKNKGNETHPDCSCKCCQ